MAKSITKIEEFSNQYILFGTPGSRFRMYIMRLHTKGRVYNTFILLLWNT